MAPPLPDRVRWSMQAAEPVKIERHDLRTREHHTSTGVRPVSVYREHAHGLYVAREFVNHPRIRHWQAHLLPDLGLVVCRYDFHGPREHDYYLDIATVTRGGEVWSVCDHYLDLLVHDGIAAEIVDTDELLAAHRAGYVTAETCMGAVTAAHGVLSGLARARYDLHAWLGTHGVALEWQADSVPA
ncbi:DUF402 domain-containing protein [Deinococcus sp. MIMF12]|uniref:DUF402 domain-containing protein n=1 Tax=Deinococcus rhizophilus TaxID=3049544 RepID=A0ABT7JLD1_9DEIO|nr:DUF402 domain-containing protein [Deinococcus rhizophilus]MDL2345746.1 DUF402 domain-containing protein [Deinococcus rhizophilus]